MLDSFDLALLDLVQRDDSRTADELATDVALSPSAIARRLRRLRAEGWIARTIALLGPALTGRRLRAMVLAQFNEVAERVLVSDATVRRYETSFVKREAKFAPFIKTSET